MNTILIDQLKRLELKQQPQKQKNPVRLRVYYGWAKLGKIRKREGISIIYENEEGVADHHRMGKVLQKAQNTVCWRYQSEGEANDAKSVNRVFTEYSVFMDDKKIRGSLNAALRANSLADQKNVSLAERTRIADELRAWYMSEHRDYKEPISDHKPFPLSSLIAIKTTLQSLYKK
jgi:signal transduction protein with GAF and PtsI domain